MLASYRETWETVDTLAEAYVTCCYVGKRQWDCY